MPKTVFGHDYRFMDRKELLTFEELERVARVFAELGVEKIRLTGGEPLLRRELETLVERLDAIDGLDLTLTTNASLLARKAEALRAAGLDRVNVSLDSLDDETFRAMNDVDFPVDAGARGDRRGSRRRPPRQGERGRQARRQRRRRRRDGAALPRHRAQPALHRVHGRRRDERVAAGRRRPGRGDRRADRRGVPARARRPRRTAARSRGGSAIATARARSASSPRSPSRSAATAPGRGSPPRASSTPACSPCVAPTCARSSAVGQRTTSSATRSRASGRAAATAIPSSAPSRRRPCRGSRCPTSADDVGEPLVPPRAPSSTAVPRSRSVGLPAGEAGLRPRGDVPPPSIC